MVEGEAGGYVKRKRWISSESWATAVDESPCCLGSRACLHRSSRGWAGYILSGNGTGTLAFYSLIKESTCPCFFP